MHGKPVISSRTVVGTAVFDDNGDKLGSINALKIDKRTGVVRYAVLEFGGALGFLGFVGVGTERYPIPWDMLKYVDALDGYLVPLTKAKIKNAPRYAEDQMPEYTDEFGREVDAHYDVH